MSSSMSDEYFEIFKKARRLFPDEDIFYDLSGTITLTEYVEQLKLRIKEKEEAQEEKNSI